MDNDYGDKAVDSFDDVKTNKADDIYGIYVAPHGLVGTDHGFVHIGSLTNDESALQHKEESQQLDDTVAGISQADARASAIMEIRDQAQGIVDSAAEAYRKLKSAVEVTNADLKSINHVKNMISADLMSGIEVFLTDSPGWFLSVLHERDKSIEALCQQLEQREDDCTNFIRDRDELQIKLEESSVGLSFGSSLRLGGNFSIKIGSKTRM
uniref:Uncharacterized protein n=1 Tax=Panagrolaimus superbus TaxID=310955 RepID=A0A914Y6B6_9BILA